MDHPNPDALRGFLLARLPEIQEREVEAHLAGADGHPGCEACLFRARGLAPEADFAREEGVEAVADALFAEDGHPAADDGDETLARVFRQAMRRRFLVDRETAAAPALLRELDRRPPRERREAIRTGRRYQLAGLSEALCEASRAAGFHDVARALELAELAVEVADSLDPGLYLPRQVADRQALARGYLGNARRVGSDLFGADRAFHEAAGLLAAGSRSELPRADLGSLLASLRVDQARYGEARRLLEEAREVYERWEEPESVGRVELKLGLCAGYSGAAEEAVERFARAAELLAEARDRRLVLYAHHNLADWLVERGDSLEALARFEAMRPLYARFPDDAWIQLRRRWLEGRIHAGLGDRETARARFEALREETERRELAYELAMVSLELAILHLDHGETAEVRSLAADLVPVFHLNGLHRHALGALYLFREAAHAERATAPLAREVLHYLHRARNNPYLRFEP